MNRRTVLQGGAAVVSAALAGCSAQGSTPSGEYDVGMSAADFKPPEVTVAPGETVVWRNTSSVRHTVTAYGDKLPDGADFFSTGDFDSQAAAETGWTRGKGGLGSGETFEHTFEIPGTYEYFCIPHEVSGMRGTVVVSEDAATTTS
ncbi:MAG: plastocyanin/azurin family copper-binding protein [Haloarculaceae archaeon]